MFLNEKKLVMKVEVRNFLLCISNLLSICEVTVREKLFASLLSAGINKNNVIIFVITHNG